MTRRLKVVNVLFINVFLCLCVYGQTGSTHATGRIRYDFELAGTKDTVIVIRKQICFEPVAEHSFYGRDTGPDYGTYRFRVYRLCDGSLFWSKGFSPLFWEWQSTKEAGELNGSFYNAIYFPQPGSDVRILIERRNAESEWLPVLSDTIRFGQTLIVEEQPVFYLCDTLMWSGPSSEKIDLVILSEGYALQEMEKFKTDSRRLTDSLFATAPFCHYRNRFNVLALCVPSLQSGTDIPGQNQYRRTVFNSTFNTFGSERYLTTSDIKSIFDGLSGVEWDQFYLVVNSDKYGGGGLYNHLNICTSDHLLSPFVFIHEFGHGFAGLADEYYSSDTAYDDMYTLTTEPWEPNLTTLIHFEEKWKELVLPGIPVPTPRSQAFSQVVGVFEGGGYQAKGIYSPWQTCWMKERAAGRFCPVCEQAIIRTIERYSMP